MIAISLELLKKVMKKFWRKYFSRVLGVTLNSELLVNLKSWFCSQGSLLE